MNLSCAMRRYGAKKAIELHSKAGFDAYDFSFHVYASYDYGKKIPVFTPNQPVYFNDYLKVAKELRKIADDNGIVCNQSHSPFPTDCKELLDLAKTSIEFTAILGGQNMVVHPAIEKSFDYNVEMYKSLLPFAKEHNVNIACENIWVWSDELAKTLNPAYDPISPCLTSHHDDLLKLVNAINDDNLVVCLDVGHAEMTNLKTSAVDIIKTLKDKVKVLHVHDNDKWHDSHLAPFTMDIDFIPIMKELKKQNYTGDLTLEVDVGLSECETDEEAIFNLKKMADCASNLREIFLKA